MTTSPPLTAFFEPLPERRRAAHDTPRPRILLSVPEAAYELGVGRTRVYELMRDGDLESVHVGRLRKIPVSALVDFVERCRMQGTEGS